MTGKQVNRGASAAAGNGPASVRLHADGPIVEIALDGGPLNLVTAPLLRRLNGALRDVAVHAVPSELGEDDVKITVVLQDDAQGQRYVKVRYRSHETGGIERAWVPLKRQPIGGLALSLVWFVVHTIVFMLAGLAYWKRPFDRPLRAYFALCAVTVVAYIGGNHWWGVDDGANNRGRIKPKIHHRTTLHPIDVGESWSNLVYLVYHLDRGLQRRCGVITWRHLTIGIIFYQ